MNTRLQLNQVAFGHDALGFHMCPYFHGRLNLGEQHDCLRQEYRLQMSEQWLSSHISSQDSSKKISRVAVPERCASRTAFRLTNAPGRSSAKTTCISGAKRWATSAKLA